jgi:hypothetical protein
MAYLDPEKFDIQTVDCGVVATGYFDNGIGARLEQQEDGWYVYNMIPEGWPEVKFEGEYSEGEPTIFEDLDDALSYMEEVQAL